MGAAAALNLRRKGFEATIIDPDPPGHGCSFGNAGAISPGSVVPIALPGMIMQTPRWLIDPLGPFVLFVGAISLKAAPWLMRWLSASRMTQVSRSARRPQAVDRLRHSTSTKNSWGPQRSTAFSDSKGSCTCGKSEHPSRSELVGHEVAGQTRDRISLASARRDQSVRACAGNRFLPGGCSCPTMVKTVQPLKWSKTIIDQFRAEGGAVEQGRVVGIHPHDDGTVSITLDDGRSVEATGVVIAAGARSIRFHKVTWCKHPAGDRTRISCDAPQRCLTDPSARWFMPT